MSALAESFCEKGMDLYRQGAVSEALKALDHAISLDALDPAPWIGKGSIYGDQGRYGEALAAFEQAIGLNPYRVGGWWGKGKVYERLGLYEEALKAYERTIELDGKLASPWTRKGNVCAELGRSDEALDAYERAIELDSKFAGAWHGEGEVLRKLGRYDEALKAYERAIELDGTLALPWSGKGNLYAELGRYDEALDAHERAIELDSKFAGAWNGKGNVCADLGRYEDALEAYERAIELDRESAEPWNGKGNVYAELGRYDEALDALERAIESDSGHALAWNGKGEVYRLLDCCEEALKAYERAIELDGKLAYPRYGKGDVHYKLEEIDEAKRCFYRFTYLASPRARWKGLPALLRFFHEVSPSPLLVDRILTENADLETYVTWAQLLHETALQCADAQAIVAYIKSPECELAEIERLKLEGLITYYMGDPITAADLFDRVDSLDPTDLAGQYYLVLTLGDYYEETSGALSFALASATKCVEGFARGGVRSTTENLYYTGLLFYLGGDAVRAISAFRAAGTFLPAMYMEMLMLDRKGQMRERDDLIRKVLQAERLLAESRRGSGFLQGITPQTIDLSSPDWTVPFRKYAHNCEISEAITLVYTWLNQYERAEGQLPAEWRFVDCNRPYELRHAHEVWLLMEEWKHRLEKVAESATEGQSTSLLAKLQSCFERVPLADLGLDQQAMEESLGALIGDVDARSSYENYYLLVKYHFLTRRLSPHAAIALLFYIYLRSLGGTVKEPGSLGKALEDAIKAATGAAITMHLSASPSTRMLLLSGGAFFTRLLIEFVRSMPEDKKSDVFPPYSVFKASFFQFLDKLREELNEDFYRSYPINDFIKW